MNRPPIDRKLGRPEDRPCDQDGRKRRYRFEEAIDAGDCAGCGGILGACLVLSVSTIEGYLSDALRLCPLCVMAIRDPSERP